MKQAYRVVKPLSEPGGTFDLGTVHMFGPGMARALLELNAITPCAPPPPPAPIFETKPALLRARKAHK